MKRRTLDLLASAGGLLVAVILLIGGIVLTSNANFAADYVKQQLGQQHITFKAAATLTDEEKQQACLVEYAGQPMETGKQAECYANHFIGLHLEGIGGGRSYAEMGDYQNELKAQIATATTAGDTAKVADLQKQLADATSARSTIFQGESLRGMLLTAYGFSELGAKASQGAMVAYIGSGLMFLLALLGFWHGLRTSPTETFAAPEGAARREKISA